MRRITYKKAAAVAMAATLSAALLVGCGSTAASLFKAGRQYGPPQALTALPRAPSPTKAPQKAPQRMQKRPQTREMQTKWPLRTAPI